MSKIYIAGALRTPIGGCSQSLKEVSAVSLGALVIKGLIEKSQIDSRLVDEVILGNVVSAGLGQNPARQSLAKAGLPLVIPAFTINKVCGSGLKSVILAIQAIKSQDADIIIAGGTESASGCPYIFARNKKIHDLTRADASDTLFSDGLWCKLDNKYMGEIAEYTVKKFNISRQDQDKYAYNSHQKACKAVETGLFKDEIIGVPTKPDTVVSFDEKPRRNISLERLANLPAAFIDKGTVTAGNSSAPADGSAALIICSEKGLKKAGIEPLAEIIGYSAATKEAKLVFTTAAEAINNCLKKIDLKASDIDIFEVNEAFSVQALVTIEQTGLDVSRLNLFGGTLALGHPLGVSGARGLVTLMNVLKHENKKIGLTSVCLGGGSALALAIRRL